MNIPKAQPIYNDKRQILNKSNIIETIVRNRIKDSIFYKQYLFLTNEQTILPIIINQVHCLAGLDSNNRPSNFLCCLLRLLEINPSREIINLFLSYPQFKYLTCLTLMFIRLTRSPVEIYTLFDTYNANYSKIRMLSSSPKIVNGIPINYSISYIDEFVDNLIHQERYLGIILPRIEPRYKLAERGVVLERQYLVKSLEEEVKEESEFESDSD